MNASTKIGMDGYTRIYEMLVEGKVKARNKAIKRAWLKRKGRKDTGEPSYRAIISTRKAARHGQEVGAATVVAGREQLQKDEKKSDDSERREGESVEMHMRRTQGWPKSAELSRRGVTPAVEKQTTLGRGAHPRKRGGGA